MAIFHARHDTYLYLSWYELLPCRVNVQRWFILTCQDRFKRKLLRELYCYSKRKCTISVFRKIIINFTYEWIFISLTKFSELLWDDLYWIVFDTIFKRFLYLFFFTKQLNDIINSKNHYYFFNFLEGSIDHRFKNLLSQYFLCQVK